MGEGIVLSDAELRALARRLVAREASEYDMWLDWGEAAPELAEACWLALVEAVEVVASALRNTADALDKAEGIDSLALIERVS